MPNKASFLIFNFFVFRNNSKNLFIKKPFQYTFQASLKRQFLGLKINSHSHIGKSIRNRAFKQEIKGEMKKYNYSNMNFRPFSSERSQISGSDVKEDCVSN